MKNLFIGAAVVFFAVLALATAQDDSKSNKTETLFGDDKLSFGVYAGFEMKPGQIDDEYGLYLGGRGMIVVNGRFGVGGGGFHLATTKNVIVDFADDRLEARKVGLDLNWGGLILEYTDSPRKLIHYTGSLLIGAGQVKFDFPFEEYDDYKHIEHESYFFVLEPAANVEVNVLKYIRVDAGVSYRLAVGSDLKYNDLNSIDASGFHFCLTAKFGMFDNISLPKGIEDAINE